jgi:hypothetical protein
MAFVPRDNVGLLERQRIAANRAVVSRLEKNLTANRNGDHWAIVAHLRKPGSVPVNGGMLFQCV